MLSEQAGGTVTCE